MQDPESDVTRLQLMLMEHERLLEQYSDLFRDQQRQIDALKASIENLELKLSKYEQDSGHPTDDERPPHY